MARVLITNPPDARGPVLDVALSERNLLTLLSKLYTRAPRVLSSTAMCPTGSPTPARAEPEEYHYASPTREGAPAGPMHPLTELVLAAVRKAAAAYLGDADGI